MGLRALLLLPILTTWLLVEGHATEDLPLHSTIEKCFNGTVWKTVGTPKDEYLDWTALEKSGDSYTYVAQSSIDKESFSFEWSRVVALDKNGNIKFDFGKGKLGTVSGLSIRGNNTIYVLSKCKYMLPGDHKRHLYPYYYHSTVQKYTLSGEFQGFWHVEDNDMFPGDIAAGPNGTVAVSLLLTRWRNASSDHISNKVVVYNDDGNISHVITGVFIPTLYSLSDTTMQLYYDSIGYLHVVDSGPLFVWTSSVLGAVRVFDESGLQVRSYSTNSFLWPGPIYVDSNDNLSYVIAATGSLHIFNLQGELITKKQLSGSIFKDVIVDNANCRVWTVGGGRYNIDVDEVMEYGLAIHY